MAQNSNPSKSGSKSAGAPPKTGGNGETQFAASETPNLGNADLAGLGDIGGVGSVPKLPASFASFATPSILPTIPRVNIFAIRTPPTLPEEVVTLALEELSLKYEEARQETDAKDSIAATAIPTSEVCARFISQKGLSSSILQITDKLNAAPLREDTRWILASRGVYHYLLLVALVDEARAQTDLEGIRQSVLLHVEDEPKRLFYETVVRLVLNRSKINLDLQQDQDIRERVVATVMSAGLSISTRRVESDVLAIVKKVMGEGDLPAYITQFAASNDIPATKFTPGVQTAMLRYLAELGIKFQKQKFDEGKYDEFFALAYNYALGVASGDQDPLSLKYRSDQIANWDFSVEQFDSVEAQGIVRENILAAGALYYIYEFGENLGMYRLADALVLRWASGALDLAEGTATTRLYQFWKRRDDRNSPEERAAVIKRVLNIGDGQVLSRSVVNEEFPALWHRLMEEAAEYIRRAEGSDDAAGQRISRASLYDATRNLQYNLSTHATGMAHMQVREMYAHLSEAIEIFKHPEITDYFGGGRRKNMWTVIERLSMDEFRQAPNVSAIQTAAIEGNKVFQWIANFGGPGTVTEQSFKSFLDSAEAWILSQASAGEGFEGEEEESAGGESEDGGDDFGDWDN
jgi:hypothetical protein